MKTVARNVTICHEMAHVFLGRLLISLPETHANECLTDLTPVYLGLGSVMLNGCMSAQVNGVFTMNGDAAGCADFCIVHCPKCDSKLRLPAEHGGNVRCPRCSHTFASTTMLPIALAQGGDVLE